MGKMHELLAVEADLKGKAAAILGETRNTFDRKGAIFKGSERTFEVASDEDEQMPAEFSPLYSTVNAKLEYTFKHLVRYMDAVVQKEATNQVAKADVVVNGSVILEKVPAAGLLSLEHRLREIIDLVKRAPTLDLKEEWSMDPDRGEHVRISRPRQTNRLVEVPTRFVRSEATEHHPAQVDVIATKRVGGVYTQTLLSGEPTPAEKAEMLERAEALLAAVKKARSRANRTEVVKFQAGKVLTDYILTGSM